MSFMSYRGVSLGMMLSTNQISRRAVTTDDGQDRLYTHWSFDMTWLFNPVALAYALDGNLIPRASPGSLPNVTDTAVRDFFMQPRGTPDLHTQRGRQHAPRAHLSGDRV